MIVPCDDDDHRWTMWRRRLQVWSAERRRQSIIIIIKISDLSNNKKIGGQCLEIWYWRKLFPGHPRHHGSWSPQPKMPRTRITLHVWKVSVSITTIDCWGNVPGLLSRQNHQFLPFQSYLIFSVTGWVLPLEQTTQPWSSSAQSCTRSWFFPHHRHKL